MKTTVLHSHLKPGWCSFSRKESRRAGQPLEPQDCLRVASSQPPLLQSQLTAPDQEGVPS